jgi:hypothetical protein
VAEEWVLHSVMQWARPVTPLHAGDGNPKMLQRQCSKDGVRWRGVGAPAVVEQAQKPERRQVAPTLPCDKGRRQNALRIPNPDLLSRGVWVRHRCLILAVIPPQRHVIRTERFGFLGAYRSIAKLMYLLAIDILGGPCTPIYLLTLITILI